VKSPQASGPETNLRTDLDRWPKKKRISIDQSPQKVKLTISHNDVPATVQGVPNVTPLVSMRTFVEDFLQFNGNPLRLDRHDTMIASGNLHHLNWERTDPFPSSKTFKFETLTKRVTKIRIGRYLAINLWDFLRGFHTR
jgi:hypothetical protein